MTDRQSPVVRRRRRHPAAASRVAIAGAAVAHRGGRHLWGFWLDAVAVAGFVGQIFLGLYPNALPSTSAGGFSLTLADAAASENSLVLITVVALVGLPLVITYQAWSFWVFRGRLRREEFLVEN